MVVLTGLEFLGGILIEKIFNQVFWDYRYLKFNFGKYVALEITLIWGIFSLAFIYILKPLFEKFINKIPRWLTILVSVIMVIDFIFTLIEA